MVSTTELSKYEAEQRLIEAVKVECEKLLEMMRQASPVEAERLKTRLDEVIKRCPKIPLALKRKITTDARALECIANTRAADACLNSAMAKAKSDDVQERNRLISQARSYASKAVSLGAAPAFRSALDRKVEIIMLTGGVAHKGPSAAKPLYTGPKPFPIKG